MNALISDSNHEGGYSAPHLKRRILTDFKDQVVISNVNGKSDVITFVSTASKILQDFNEKLSRKSLQKKENCQSCI